MSFKTLRALTALRTTAGPTTIAAQKRTMYFCGLKAGTHGAQWPQHYLAGPSDAPGAQVAAKIVKDPATSATVDMTSSVTEDIKRLEDELKGPITTVWADEEKKDGEVVVGAGKMLDGEGKI